MTEPIYLDYNATTPVDPGVLDAMLPWFSEGFWNAASAHALGRRADAAVAAAREQIGDLIGASSSRVFFTSGATEANNAALKGAVEAASAARSRVVVAATEHKAVLDTAEWLAERGSPISVVPVTPDGIVDLDAYDTAIDDDVAIVSVMLANNETGVIAPVARLAEIAHERGALFHTDAVQALGRIPIDVTHFDVDLASFSAHKTYGPKGVGCLYIKRGVQIAPLIHGGGHEKGMRSGTLNVPGIVGFGAAARTAVALLETEARRQNGLVGQLVEALRSQLADVDWVAETTLRLPNTALLRFRGADAEAVIANLPDVAVSSGSACTSRVPSPSHVLVAMGLGQAAAECVRFSVGRPTTEFEIGEAARRVADVVERVRAFDG